MMAHNGFSVTSKYS